MAWPLLAIPIVTAGASLLGGAMSMAGGAASLAGATLNTAATIGGIAADAAQGVIGAAGGLLGGGKSGNKEETPAGTFRDDQGVLRADGSGANRRGTYASDPKKGMTQAKVKAAIDPTNAEGPVSTLPTGDESDNQILTQILGQIRMNTGILGSMSASLTSMVSSGAAANRASNIEGQNTDDNKKSGNMVSSVFGKLSTGLKKLSGGLGSTGKFLAKGLAIGGLLYFFMKFKDDIRDILAKTFKIGLEFYEGIRDGEITIESIVDAAKKKIGQWADSVAAWGMEIYEVIKPLAERFFAWMFYGLKVIINDLVGFKLFETKGDLEVQREQKKLTTNQRELNKTKQLINVGSGVDGAITDEDLGFIRYSGTGNNAEVGDFGGTGTKVDAKLGISPADRDQMTLKASKVLENMWQISRDSNWAIQWTNLGFEMQDGDIPFDIADGLRASMGAYAGGMNKPVQISDINASQPIVGNELLKREDLANIMLYKQAGVNTQMDGDKRAEILENQAKIAELRRRAATTAGGTYRVEDIEGGVELFGKTYFDTLGYQAGIETQIASLQAKNVSLGGNSQTFESYQPKPVDEVESIKNGDTTKKVSPSGKKPELEKLNLLPALHEAGSQLKILNQSNSRFDGKDGVTVSTTNLTDNSDKSHKTSDTFMLAGAANNEKTQSTLNEVR